MARSEEQTAEQNKEQNNVTVGAEEIRVCKNNNHTSSK
jgi:hypothetical protein